MEARGHGDKALSYLTTLCSAKPNRRTGSPGNREATDFFAGVVREFGFEIDATPFDCLDYAGGKSSFMSQDKAFEVFTSPYSLGCDVPADLIAVSTIQDLERAVCEGKILLMRGEICSEQLMPKEFVFYNPEHHQKIITLLEQRNPAVIITATAKSPEQVGALYPFPLIVDGDFHIPNAYCTDDVGQQIARNSGDLCHMVIDAKRIRSSASNVIARMNPGVSQKIVVTAHIDAYEDSPGASDNASGTVVLMLLAEMLSNYRGQIGIEIAALNGEDHYSAGGQMDYLDRYGNEFDKILLAVNVDGVGYVKGKSNYSYYDCPPGIQKKAESVFKDHGGIARGEQWFNGDHMIFVQNGVPSIAFTAELILELMASITHTPIDTPDIVDPVKLVEVAAALAKLMAQF